MKTAARALLAWGAILVLAVLNGLLLCALIVSATWLLLPWLGTRDQPALLLIGLAWLLLTLTFEFAFGLSRGHTLATLLAAYSFRGGNLWPLVLAVTVAAPSLAAWLRRRH